MIRDYPEVILNLNLLTGVMTLLAPFDFSGFEAIEEVKSGSDSEIISSGFF